MRHEDNLVPLICDRCRNVTIVLVQKGTNRLFAWCAHCDMLSNLSDPTTTSADWTAYQVERYTEHPTSESSLGTEREKWVWENIPPPYRLVADFGCSDGTFANLVASKGYEVEAFDLPQVLGKFNLRPSDNFGRTARFYPHDFDHENGWGEGAYDVVLALEILEHLKLDLKFIEDCYHVLKREGLLILTVPLRNNVMESDAHLRYYPDNVIRKLLLLVGFEKVTMRRGTDSLLTVAHKIGGASEQ